MWIWLLATLAVVSSVSPCASQEIVAVRSPRAATVGAAFRGVYRAAGGRAPYTWLVSGLPADWRFRQEGPRCYVEGSPVQEGPAGFDLRLLDSAGLVLQRTVRLQVFRKIQFVSPPSLPAGAAGLDYRHQLRTNEVTSGTRFYLTDGRLPSGLGHMNGEIWGKPSQAGTAQFAVRAVAYQDGIGFIEGNEAEQTFTLAVNGNPPPPTCPVWPSGWRPFSSLAYVVPRGVGNSTVVLLVGTPSDPQTFFAALSRVPVPQTGDQFYCTSVEIAPGLWAKPALPTVAERNGDFHEYAGRLLDPASYRGGPFPSGMIPFPGGIIALARMPYTYAWRVDTYDSPQTAIPGTLDAASYAPELTQNSWATLFGNNLTVGTRTWVAGDFVNGRLPAALAQISINVTASSLASKAAAIPYASPGQVNFLVPSLEIDPDQPFVYTAVSIRNELWQGSWDAKVRRVAPKAFLFEQGGRVFPAAVNTDGSLTGPVGLYPGSRPAAPGEIVQIFCSGLGATNPPVPDGQVIQSPLPLTHLDDFVVRIGGTVAQVQYAGLVSPGLYQVNVVVPSVPAAAYPLEIEAEGRASPPGVVLVIGR